MKRLSLALVVSLSSLAVACGGSTTAPSGQPGPTFTAQMLPANETTAVVGDETASSGNVTITFVTTQDASGNVTSATATAVVNVQGLPAGSAITLAHIHTGGPGVAGAVLVPFPPGAVTLTGGAGSFTTTTAVAGSDATNIMNNPAGFYFNVHTAANAGGVMRGQLVRTQ
jgi:hypothetical protein